MRQFITPYLYDYDIIDLGPLSGPRAMRSMAFIGSQFGQKLFHIFQQTNIDANELDDNDKKCKV